MKKKIFIIINCILYSTFSIAQINDDFWSTINGNTKYYDAVDNWVIWNTNKEDNTFTYGYIYLDNTAGFTYHFVGSAKVVNNRVQKLEDQFEHTSIKVRIDPKISPVFVLTAEMRNQLDLPTEPSWLAAYKKGKETVAYLKNVGYHYNHVGAPHLALEPLLLAYEKDMHFEGLEFELAYAYNALGRYNESIEVLDKAIANNSHNFYFYRELGFALKNLDKIKKASEVYLKGIALSENDFEKSEMAVNMAQYYFLKKNKKSFKKWAKLVRKYSKKGKGYSKYVDTYEKEWDNDKFRQQR